MINVLLVDDQKIICEGLKALLEPVSDLQIVGSANNGQTAIEQVEALKPDIVIIDIEMPQMDGLTATQIITRRFTNTKVLVLSGCENEEYLTRALQAGARGYLLKTAPATELAHVIRATYQGYVQIGPGMFEKLTSSLTAAKQIVPPLLSSSIELDSLELTEHEIVKLRTDLEQSYENQQFLKAQLRLTTSAFRKVQREFYGLRELLNFVFWAAIGIIGFSGLVFIFN